MTQEEKAKEKEAPKATRKRSGLMKLLGSTKITPILGLAALISILYYKNKSTKPPKKKAKVVSQVDRKAPLLAPLAELGRTREGGPLLTRGYFSQGDLVLRKVKGKLEAGLIAKSKRAVDVLPLGGGKSPLLAWIKAGDGHFALLRIKGLSAASWAKLKAYRKANSGKSIHPRALYAAAGVALPASLSAAGLDRKQWFAAMLKQSHYNDFPPPRP